MPSEPRILSWKKSTDDLIYVNDSFLAKVKADAHKLHKARKRAGQATTLSGARDDCAARYGFKSWSNLHRIYTHEGAYSYIRGTLVEPYAEDKIENAVTNRQEYGAVCRRFGIDPFHKKFEIHVTLAEERAIEYLADDQLCDLGLVHDHLFEASLINDPLFSDGCDQVYRLLSIDSNNFEKIDQHLETLGEDHEDCSDFWPLWYGHCWINGRLDPGTLKQWEIDEKEYPGIPRPLEELPKSAWKSPYQ